jgi:hypothetical protein
VRNLANPHPVARLEALTELMAQAEIAREGPVAEARRMPKPPTWEEIGRAAGLAMTRAHEKWKHLDPKYSAKKKRSA